MYDDDIVRARAQLQTLDERSGKQVLLTSVSQTERLCFLLHQALTRVSDHAGNLVEFYDALVGLRQFLDSARETLTQLDKDLSDQSFESGVSHEGYFVVRPLFRTLSRELDDLFFALPAESKRPKSGPRLLDLTAIESSNPAPSPD